MGNRAKDDVGGPDCGTDSDGGDSKGWDTGESCTWKPVELAGGSGTGADSWKFGLAPVEAVELVMMPAQ